MQLYSIHLGIDNIRNIWNRNRRNFLNFRDWNVRNSRICDVWKWEVQEVGLVGNNFINSWY
uniref:Uncharacterized protein n=1 Tax=Rhizophagus irregularis (strain DAOM 181602 / DAOM 197198 / MUCL 43194) TaxID=747089 RepID=U9SZK3_RHIID